MEEGDNSNETNKILTF